MERSNRVNSLNEKLAVAIFDWQKKEEGGQDDVAASELIGAIIEEASKNGLNLTLEIEGTSKNFSEDRRAFLFSDITKMGRQNEKGNWVLKFFPPRSPKPMYRLTTGDGYLKISDRRFGELVPSSYISPRQIVSLSVSA